MSDCRFQPSAKWLEEQKNIPSFWKGDYSDVVDASKEIKRGRVTVGCKSAGGRDVFVIEYGEPNKQNRLATYSSALGAGNLNFYSDKNDKDYKPCIFLIGCVHGGEFEGTAAILNLIKLLECGVDYSGNENRELEELAQNAHLILIPCVNPDGRVRVPFKGVLGMDYKVFRYYDQGMWSDGRMCDWPEVKRIHPIKNHVKYLGGYFNDDGVNLMHDNFFNPLANETRLMMSLAAEYAPDFIVNFHGATGCNPSFCDSAYLPDFIKEELFRFENNIKDACEAEGIPFNVSKRQTGARKAAFPAKINLTWALHHTCGGISLTHESQQGVINNPKGMGCNEWDVGYEHIYREHIICITEILKYTRDICSERINA